MADPLKKSKEKGKIMQAAIRSAVQLAMNENKAHVMLDARPCSIEVGRNTKGELSWNVKLYTIDPAETLDTVATIRAIEEQILTKFRV